MTILLAVLARRRISGVGPPVTTTLSSALGALAALAGGWGACALTPAPVDKPRKSVIKRGR